MKPEEFSGFLVDREVEICILEVCRTDGAEVYQLSPTVFWLWNQETAAVVSKTAWFIYLLILNRSLQNTVVFCIYVAYDTRHTGDLAMVFEGVGISQVVYSIF